MSLKIYSSLVFGTVWVNGFIYKLLEKNYPNLVWNCGSSESAIHLMVNRINWRETASHFPSPWSPLFGLIPKVKNVSHQTAKVSSISHQMLSLLWKQKTKVVISCRSLHFSNPQTSHGCELYPGKNHFWPKVGRS